MIHSSGLVGDVSSLGSRAAWLRILFFEAQVLALFLSLKIYKNRLSSKQSPVLWSLRHLRSIGLFLSRPLLPIGLVNLVPRESTSREGPIPFLFSLILGVQFQNTVSRDGFGCLTHNSRKKKKSFLCLLLLYFPLLHGRAAIRRKPPFEV